MIDRLVGHLY